MGDNDTVMTTLEPPRLAKNPEQVFTRAPTAKKIDRSARHNTSILHLRFCCVACCGAVGNLSSFHRETAAHLDLRWPQGRNVLDCFAAPQAAAAACEIFSSASSNINRARDTLISAYTAIDVSKFLTLLLDAVPTFSSRRRRRSSCYCIPRPSTSTYDECHRPP